MAGAKSEGLRVEERQLPVGKVAEQSGDRAGHAASGRLGLDRDRLTLLAGAKERRIDADWNQRVVALETLCSCVGDRLRRCEAASALARNRSRRERRGG